METKKDYTTAEIIEITLNNLGAIDIPGALIEKIGIPIAQNINNLRIALDKLKGDEPEVVDLGEINLDEKGEDDA